MRLIEYVKYYIYVKLCIYNNRFFCDPPKTSFSRELHRLSTKLLIKYYPPLKVENTISFKELA